MANLEVQPKWSSVRQLESLEFARGGLNGNMNEQAKSLTERTNILRTFGGVLPFDNDFCESIYGYQLNGKVLLDNGIVVKSIIQGNTNNPNIDMTGWVFDTFEVYVKDFGIIGGRDNDEGEAIQDVIDYAVSIGASFVVFDQPEYMSSITLEYAGRGKNSRNGVILKGQNQKKTTIYLKTDQDDLALTLSMSPSGTNSAHGLKNISLKPHPDNLYKGTGLKLVGTSFFKAENFNIERFNTNLHFYNTREFEPTDSDADLSVKNAFCEYNSFVDGRIFKGNTNILFETTSDNVPSVKKGDSSFHGNNFDRVQNQVKEGGTGIHLKGSSSKIAVWYNSFVNMNFWTTIDLVNEPMILLKLEYSQCSGLTGHIHCEGSSYIDSIDDGISYFRFEGNFTGLRDNEYPIFRTNDAGKVGGPRVVFHNLNSRSTNLAESSSSFIGSKFLKELQALSSKFASFAGDRLSRATIKRLTNSTTNRSGTYEGLALGVRTDSDVVFGENPVDAGEYKFIPRIAIAADGTIKSFSDSFRYFLKFFDRNGIASDQNTGYVLARGAFYPDLTNSVSLGLDGNRWAQGRYQGLDINISGINPTVSDSHDWGSSTRRIKQLHTTSITLHNTNGIQFNANNAYNIASSSSVAKDCYLQNAPTVVSDERKKEQIHVIDDALLDAWADVQFQQWKLIDSVLEKGNEARWHFGFIAQNVRDTLIAHGLDWAKYGLITYESWNEVPASPYKPAVVDDYGSLISEEVEAIKWKQSGEIYMLRMEECLAVEAAFQRRKLKEIEDQLNQFKSTI